MLFCQFEHFSIVPIAFLVISRYAGCFFVLLNDLSGEEAKGVASRLSEEWKKPEGAEQIEAAYELAEIDG